MEDSEAVIQQQNREDFGKSEYGFEVANFVIRIGNALSNPKDRHELVRRDVSQVICAVCDTEQQVAHVCSKCGVKMGAYFCEICRFYDDDTTKEQFHCDDCGICRLVSQVIYSFPILLIVVLIQDMILYRVGGREKFFHCKKCGKRSDYLPGYAIIRLLDTEVSDDLSTVADSLYRCPICSKSLWNMSRAWERLDEEVGMVHVGKKGKAQALSKVVSRGAGAYFGGLSLGRLCVWTNVRYDSSSSIVVLLYGISHTRLSLCSMINFFLQIEGTAMPEEYLMR
ncbi:hypothetical protein C3L33_07572, partial [Rhododendron williamsianum]